MSLIPIPLQTILESPTILQCQFWGAQEFLWRELLKSELPAPCMQGSTRGILDASEVVLSGLTGIAFKSQTEQDGEVGYPGNLTANKE